MWDVVRNHVSACSNSVQLLSLHPIIISILFHHYKELKECISEVEQIMMEPTATVNHKQGLKKKEERMEGHPHPLSQSGLQQHRRGIRNVYPHYGEQE
jgi:hypothetical protein